MFPNPSVMHLCPFPFFALLGRRQAASLTCWVCWCMAAWCISIVWTSPSSCKQQVNVSLYPSSFYLAKSDNSVSGLLLTFAWRLPRLSSGACLPRASRRRGVSSHKAGAFSCSSADSSIKPTHPPTIHPSVWIHLHKAATSQRSDRAESLTLIRNVLNIEIMTHKHHKCQSSGGQKTLHSVFPSSVEASLLLHAETCKQTSTRARFEAGPEGCRHIQTLSVCFSGLLFSYCAVSLTSLKRLPLHGSEKALKE